MYIVFLVASGMGSHCDINVTVQLLRITNNEEYVNLWKLKKPRRGTQ